MDITIRLLEAEDIQIIASSFAEIGSKSKTATLYERYLAEQEKGERVILVARAGADFCGYLTIQWQSDYPPFAEKGIPEIKDLNVLPDFRRQGIASRLVDEAEKRIFERTPVAGIGVGMYEGYGPAQRMYILRGYVPDGRGLFHGDKPVVPYEDVRVDDDLVLYLTKERAD